MGDNAVHDGIFILNFAAGKRRENSSIAFGKVAVGNALLGNAFFRNDALRNYRGTGSDRVAGFMMVKYYSGSKVL